MTHCDYCGEKCYHESEIPEDDEAMLAFNVADLTICEACYDHYN